MRTAAATLGAPVLCCALGCALWTGTARAQVEQDEQTPDHLSDSGEDEKLRAAERDHEAREKFNQGRKAYEDGEYRDAWDYFRQAYVLSRRPELLYNVGQSADRLGLSKEALKAFRMYLRDAEEPANRRDVENRVRALEKTVQREKEIAAAEGKTVDDGDDSGIGDDSAEDSIGVPDVPDGEQPTREGWYLRGALGLGGLYSGAEGAGTDVSLTGGGIGGEFLFGKRITAEIVLGGGVFFLLSRPERDDGGKLDRANLFLIGPIIDYYLAPLTDGLHIQGGVAFGSFDMARTGGATDTVGTKPASGGGLMAGVGYEWPVYPEVGAGALARVMLASMTQDDVLEYAIVSVSVLGTATWY